jgi:hypothetical protein
VGYEVLSVVGQREPLRSEIDPRHLLLSAISLRWFPMVSRPLTADLGFNPDSRAFTDERTKQAFRGQPSMMLRRGLSSNAADNR